jgi:hypothetical protein
MKIRIYKVTTTSSIYSYLLGTKWSLWKTLGPRTASFHEEYDDGGEDYDLPGEYDFDEEARTIIDSNRNIVQIADFEDEPGLVVRMDSPAGQRYFKLIKLEKAKKGE